MDFSSQIASQLNATAIAPEAIVTVTLLLVLVGDLIFGRKSSQILSYLAVGGLLIAVVALIGAWDNPAPTSFLGSFVGDNLSIVFRAIIALSTAITILMSIAYIENTGTSLAEFICIMLTATLGGMLLSAGAGAGVSAAAAEQPALRDDDLTVIWLHETRSSL